MSIEMVENIPLRLRDELKRLNLSIAGASRDVGEASPQRLKDVLSGRQKCPVELLVRLETAGVDISYVLTGRTDHEAPKGRQAGAGPVLHPDGPGPGYSPIPMYDIEAAAGSGRLFDAENIESTLYFETAQLLAEGLSPEQIVGAKVRGDSMGETLRDGDQVLVDRSQRTPDGVFLLRMGDGLRIKRVQRVAGGALMLISDNTHYQPEMVKPQDLREVEIIGRCEIRIGRIQ